MNTADDRRAPIGYVLRKLDRLIEERFAEVFGEHGITRRQWQTMNVLTDGGRPLAALDDALAPFLDRVGGETAERHLLGLAQQGFVHQDGDLFTLTDAGRALLAGVTGDVHAIREVTTAGLDERQYDETMATLQTMIRNLEEAR
jgi:DNA-binding MarR family transcriptional regulator